MDEHRKGMGTGTGTEFESSFGNGNEDEYGNGDGNEDGIGEGRGGVRKRKKPYKNCRRDQALLFRTRHHLYRQRVALAGTRQLRSQGLVPIHAHRSEGVTGSERRKGANGVEGGIGVGGGNGDGNGVGGGNGNRDGGVTGTGTGVEANEGAQDENEDGSGSGDGAGTGTGTRVETRGRTQDGNEDGRGDGNESSSGNGNGDEDGNGNGNEDRIGEGRREAKKRKTPHKSCRRLVGNGGDLGRKRGKCRKERVGAAAANPDNLDNNKEAGGGAQGTQGLSKNCTSRESVSLLSRLIRGFRNSFIEGGINASGIE